MESLDGFYNCMYPFMYLPRGHMVGELVDKDEEFRKYDTGKLEYTLLPDSVINDILKVMMYGAYTKGYGTDNWKKCKDVERYYNALRRHIDAFRTGEEIDKESGLPHLAHALCNLAFWHYLTQEGKRNARQTEAG